MRSTSVIVAAWSASFLLVLPLSVRADPPATQPVGGPSSGPSSQPVAVDGQDAKAVVQAYIDAMDRGDVAAAKGLIVPYPHPGGERRDQMMLEAQLDAYQHRAKVTILDAKSQDAAAMVAIRVASRDKPDSFYSDNHLLVRRDGEWRIIPGKIEEYELSELETDQIAELRLWYVLNEDSWRK